jgi:hypothetical protein
MINKESNGYYYGHIVDVLFDMYPDVPVTQNDIDFMVANGCFTYFKKLCNKSYVVNLHLIPEQIHEMVDSIEKEVVWDDDADEPDFDFQLSPIEMDKVLSEGNGRYDGMIKIMLYVRKVKLMQKHVRRYLMFKKYSTTLYDSKLPRDVCDKIAHLAL